MAKGVLGKLGCMLGKWRGRSQDGGGGCWRRRHRGVHDNAELEAREEDKREVMGGGDPAEEEYDDENVPEGMVPVYVGDSRRRYLIHYKIVGHRAFQILAGDHDGEGRAVFVRTEVRLFECLLQMLKNSDLRSESDHESDDEFDELPGHTAPR